MWRIVPVVFLLACPPSKPENPPAIVSFVSSSNHLPVGGGHVTFSWVVADAKGLSLDPGVGEVSGTKKDVRVDQTTTYTLTASNDRGHASASVTVEVDTPPGVPSFSVAPAAISEPGFVTLTYQAKDATSISIDNGVGPLAWEAGSESVWVDQTTTFTLTTNTGSKSVTVRR